MNVVLDASAAAEIAKRSPLGVDFLNMLLRAEEVTAPDLYISEISNVMWKLWLLDKKNAKRYHEMASDCIEYVDTYFSSEGLWLDAMTGAQEHMHSVYDMLYVVLAQKNNAKLLTGDLRLKGTCEKLGVGYYDAVPHTD